MADTNPSPSSPATGSSNYNYISNIVQTPPLSENTKRIRSNTINAYDYADFVQNNMQFPKPSSIANNGIRIYDFSTEKDYLKTEINAVKGNLNLLSPDGSSFDYKELNRNLFTKFNRFKVPFPDYHLPKTFAYVFLTRPDLNLFHTDPNTDNGPVDYKRLHSQVANDPIYAYLFKNNANILLALTNKGLASDHYIHPFLSNAANSFELSDEFVKTVEHGETFTGFKVQYGKHNIESQTAGSFSINYVDDQELTIYKTHKAWVEYISRVYRGSISPKRDYILHRILDYAVSAYYILCGPDGESILFWSKYYGVFPTNTPASTASWSKGNLLSIPEYNISYAYAFKEDFSPLSLAEFNTISTGSFVYRKTYETDLLSTGKSLTGSPFIDTVSKGGDYYFKLRFRN